MSSLLVRGGPRLTGRIEPSANKNAVLPVLCATLLCEAPVTLRNVPEITDVLRIADFFGQLGSTVEWDKAGKVLRVDHATISKGASATLPQAMRASIMMIPGLIVRLGEVRLEHAVKGCTLGAREIDPHVAVFRAFGADVSEDGGEREEGGDLVEVVRERVVRPAQFGVAFDRHHRSALADHPGTEQL